MMLAETLVGLHGGAMAEELWTEQGTVARDMAVGNSLVLEEGELVKYFRNKLLMDYFIYLGVLTRIQSLATLLTAKTLGMPVVA